jgi:hypothetical protein
MEMLRVEGMKSVCSTRCDKTLHVCCVCVSCCCLLLHLLHRTLHPTRFVLIIVIPLLPLPCAKTIFFLFRTTLKVNTCVYWSAHFRLLVRKLGNGVCSDFVALLSPPSLLYSTGFRVCNSLPLISLQQAATVRGSIGTLSSGTVLYITIVAHSSCC